MVRDDIVQVGTRWMAAINNNKTCLLARKSVMENGNLWCEVVVKLVVLVLCPG